MIGRRTTHLVREKLRRLQMVTDLALSGLEVDELLAQLLERTRDLLSVDTAAILLLEPGDSDLVATAAAGMPDDAREGVRIPVGQGFAGRIAASGEPVVLTDVDPASTADRFLIDANLVSAAGAPMLAAGRVIGVLHVGSLTRRTFSDDDVELLRLVADRASMATQARLAQLDRTATLALQRSLLPSRLTTIGGFDFAARYIPGAKVGVGGDWYDIFSLPSGHIGLVIGDVAGNGLHAAVVMGRIRSALRAYALESDDPADVLTRLDRKIQLFEPNAMATALYALIDPGHEQMTLSVAGHLPPLLVDASGKAEMLAAPADFPLGAFPNAPRQVTVVPLPPRSAMIFYTDGLVERRGHYITDRIADLITAIEPGTADHLCRRALTLLEGQPATDDVAVLVVRKALETGSAAGERRA